MKIFIHIDTGLATAKLTDTSALSKIEFKRGDDFELYCVFHNGSTHVELPASTIGVLAVKQRDKYLEPTLILVSEWEKQSAASNGYLFRFTASTEPLNNLIADTASITAMGEVTWQRDGVSRTTQTIPIVIANDVYKENEPPPASGGETWPPPSVFATKEEVAAVQAQVDGKASYESVQNIAEQVSAAQGQATGALAVAQAAAQAAAALATYEPRSAAFDAEAGHCYALDTSAAAFDVTLPMVPFVGETIRLADAQGTWGNNAPQLTAPDGETIDGSPSPYTLNTPAAVTAIYVGGEKGWAIYE